MAKEQDLGKIEANALVSQLVQAGVEDAVTLTGFLTPSDREGYVRLFPGLHTMARSIEIAEGDIVAKVDLPKSRLGAVAIWVKRDAALHHHIVETAQACAARTPAGELSNVQRGGLRMKVRSQTRDTCTCEYICDGTQCVPCTCNCLPR